MYCLSSRASIGIYSLDDILQVNSLHDSKPFANSEYGSYTYIQFKLCVNLTVDFDLNSTKKNEVYHLRTEITTEITLQA